MNFITRNLGPKHLRAFVHLAESLSFSRTAEHFHYTQPSLSKIIKELESELGRPLFERTTRHVALTADGVELIGTARRIIRHYDEGLQELMSNGSRLANKVAISALPSLASALLPPVVMHLESLYPGVTAEIYDCSSEAALHYLLRDQVNFALTSADPTRRELLYEELLRDRFILMSAGRMAEDMQSSVSLRDLNDLPVLSMSAASTAQKYMVAAFTNRDASFRPKMVFDQISTIGSFVEAGLGVAVLPYLAVRMLSHLKGLRITEIRDGPTRSIGILTLRDSEFSPIADASMAALRRETAKILDEMPRWLNKAGSSKN